MILIVYGVRSKTEEKNFKETFPLASSAYNPRKFFSPNSIFLLSWEKCRKNFWIWLTPRFFYNFLKIWKIAHFKNTTEPQSRFLGKNYVGFALKGFWQPRGGKMPDKCLVFGCNNRPSKTDRISLHPIPFEGTDEP